MTSSDDERLRSRTIRELGGEIWAELSHIPEEDIRWQVKSAVIDLVMAVLARHSGMVLENDEDLPVEPLPLRLPPTDDGLTEQGGRSSPRRTR
jgi:hypothetical protein